MAGAAAAAAAVGACVLVDGYVTAAPPAEGRTRLPPPTGFSLSSLRQNYTVHRKFIHENPVRLQPSTWNTTVPHKVIGGLNGRICGRRSLPVRLAVICQTPHRVLPSTRDVHASFGE